MPARFILSVCPFSNWPHVSQEIVASEPTESSQICTSLTEIEIQSYSHQSSIVEPYCSTKTCVLATSPATSPATAPKRLKVLWPCKSLLSRFLKKGYPWSINAGVLRAHSKKARRAHSKFTLRAHSKLSPKSPLKVSLKSPHTKVGLFV